MTSSLPVDQTLRLSGVAEALWAAENSGIPTGALTVRGRPLDLADAYAIQRMNLIRRFRRGEKTVGHKVGLTSAEMRTQLGVDSPDFGVLTDAMTIEPGGHIGLTSLIEPRIEAEFAFTLDRTIPGWAVSSLDDLRSAIGGVSIAIEVIDSRVTDWKVSVADTVADNASCARIVVGQSRRSNLALLDSLPGIRLILMKDGAPVAAGRGEAVLGDPLASLHWLSRALRNFGEGFEKGDVVLTGAVHASLPLDSAHWSVLADGFESVELTAI